MADRDLTEEEVADLKEAFAMFDINGDGRCSDSEIKDCMIVTKALPLHGGLHYLLPVCLPEAAMTMVELVEA